MDLSSGLLGNAKNVPMCLHSYWQKITLADEKCTTEQFENRLRCLRAGAIEAYRARFSKTSVTDI